MTDKEIAAALETALHASEKQGDYRGAYISLKTTVKAIVAAVKEGSS